MELYKKTLYTADHRLIIHPIWEYDVVKSNISILKHYKLITDAQYKIYCNMPKIDRQVSIGKLIRQNKDLQLILDKALQACRAKLMQLNSLEEQDILSIKKDAMFTLMPCNNLVISKDIFFVCKNVYSLFIRVLKLELYFTMNENSYILDVKGISDDVLPKHFDGFYIILCEVCSYIVNNNIIGAIKYIREVYSKYISKNLPIQYYREFNSWHRDPRWSNH